MDTDKRTVYEFGDFLLESGQRRLLRRESREPIALTAKAFDTLLHLVEHRGETLDKDTLLHAIWPGVIVEENSLTQNISTLRQVLGETRAENRYIATVPRKGYRFVGEVTKRAALAAPGVTAALAASGASAPLIAPGASAALAAASVTSPPACPVPAPPAGLGITAAPAGPAPVDLKRSLRPVWVSAAVLLALVAVGTFLFQRGRSEQSAAPATLAVLPFKPMYPAQRDESLELGMTESVIASLGARAGLTIRPLSSARRYGSIEQDPLVAGRALHAESVLDGSLQHNGDQLRVSVRLLRVTDGRELWAHQYDGNVTAIFHIQEQISARVAEILSARFSAAHGASTALGGTKDSTAYLLYANGRYALARSTEPSLGLGIGYFEKAIERDPQFALAHVGLADCYMVLGVFGMRPPSETLPRARDAALKALQIEPRLADAYSTLGHVKMQYDRDWEGAEADFARAIALNPALSDPHLYWGVLLGMRGEFDRGLEELKQAEQLEPLLTIAKTRAASLLYFARRYEEAIAQITESLALDDRPGIAHALLGRVYLHTGRYNLALAEFAQTRGPTPGSYGDVGQALALSGRRSEALAELDRVLKLSVQRYVPAVDIASIYASLGDTENALTWLDRALQQRASTLGFLAQNPTFDRLHDDPRFAALVDRVGLWKRPLAK
ncbi:MAG: winged helix-turn-helix domain-containing tetratricopeptide repeat protein [Steroidobacteraceae bacterium]